MSGNARYPIIEGGFVCQGSFAEIFSKFEPSSPTVLQLDFFTGRLQADGQKLKIRRIPKIARPVSTTLCGYGFIPFGAGFKGMVSDERFSEKIQSIIRESLYYLPTKHSTMLFDFITDYFSSLGTDTQSNINFITNRAVQRIIKPILIS